MIRTDNERVRVKINVPQDELDQVRRQAAALGLSVSAYLRLLIAERADS